MLSPKQSLALLALYEEEVKSRIAVLKPCGLSDYFGDLLHASRIREIEYVRESSVGESTLGLGLANEVWEDLTLSAMNDRLYGVVLRFLSKVDQDLHACVCVEAYKSELVVGFRQLLNHSSQLMSLLPADALLTFTDELQQTAGELGPLIEPVSNRFTRKEVDPERAKKLLFRSIPLFSVWGYQHLLFALSKCSAEAKAFVESIHRGFFSDYDRLRSEVSKKLADGDIAETLAHVQAGIARPSFDARLSQIPENHLKPLYVDTCKEVPLNQREYQRELSEEACEGKNVVCCLLLLVICAPTGSGKTIVCAYIVRRHIYAAIRANKRPKVCFLVPTTTLVEQQVAVLKKYLEHCVKVQGISSLTMSLSNPVRQTIEACEVVVATPMMILNLLEGLDSALDASIIPFSLTSFSLLIFDEAHHAKEKHPYNKILEIYHELKETKAFNPKASLPQIVGMTASLGVGGTTQSKGLDEAIEHTLRMCSNLDSQHINRVRNNLEELRTYLPVVADETIEVSTFDFTSLEHYRAFEKEMRYIEDLIISIPEDITLVASAYKDGKLCDMLSFDKQDASRLSQEYENWVCSLSKEIATLRTLTDASRRQVIECLDLLRSLNLAVELLKLFGTATALEYINEQLIASYRRENCSEIVRHVWKMLDAAMGFPSHESALFLKLVALLHGQFSNTAESRVLIFATRRDYCCKMSALLNEKISPSGIKVDYLTGVGASVADGGQSLGLQKSAIEDFHKGKIRVLCATTVAEEGLDISECNLVVNYESITNEIAYIQRRGRGRAKEARFVLLATREGVTAKKQQNVIREQLMYEALDVVDRQPRSWFTGKVEKYQEEMRKARLLAKTLATEREEQRSNDMHKYLVVCRKCSSYLTSSERIVVHNNSQYVCVDPEFWTRVEARKMPFDPKANTVGEQSCASVGCGNRLGRVLLANNIQLPCIKCSGITFIQVEKNYTALRVPPNDQGHVRTVKEKWKAVNRDLFTPRKIKSLDFKEMQQAQYRPLHLT